jgi:DNA-binding transcriptional ArsR family regulator
MIKVNTIHMPKVTLDMNTFKALASDTRLDILRALDGKKMSLKDICKQTRLNKATLHEHLVKLNEAGLVKRKEREGHKWVYYKLTWKGEGLLHPENTRIVVLFTMTFMTLTIGVIQLVNFVKGRIVAKAVNFFGSDSTSIYLKQDEIFSKIGSSAPSTMGFDQAPVANVPLTNQTLDQLSVVVTQNVKEKGLFGDMIKPDSINWELAEETVRSSGSYANEGIESLIPLGAGADGASNVPPSMFAVVHDPALQTIAVICIVVFAVLLCFGIWRFRKNRKAKL